MYENPTANSPELTGPCELGGLLKRSMAEKLMSMRQFSKLTGISTATVSRIIAGKQVATVHHVETFARHLNLPIERLLNAMGVANMERTPGNHSFLIEMIQDVVQDFSIDMGSIVSDVQKELKKLELYAGTKEGKKVILDGFQAKIDSIDGAGAILDQLRHFYALFQSTDLSGEEQAVVGSALLYFILTIDVIPDYLFPIGYLDEGIAVKLVEKKLLQMES